MLGWWWRVRNRVESWLRDYDTLQHLALLLLYIQIGSALIGSLGAMYTGVLLANLSISLFALVAIESTSQTLTRTYALLLSSSLLLDLAWFFLFSHDIFTLSPPSPSPSSFSFAFSVKLTFSMQIVGFSVRLSSSFLWFQIYRLGLSSVHNSAPPRSSAPDYDLPNSFLSPPTPALPREFSDSDPLVLGGSIYDPAYYSSLFEDGHHNQNQRPGIGGNGSTSSIDAP